MVEALAVLHALVWAYERQWSLVEICMDCLHLVRGLRRVDEVHVLEVHVLVRLVLVDILKFACNFS